MKRFDLLRSPVFLFSLFLLVANDWLLKPVFHNALTGKLSDFSGLTAFTLFCLALIPRRPWITGAAIAISFIYWKSPYSQGLIDAVNGGLPFHIGRVADYSDLIALPVVAWVCSCAPGFRLLKLRQIQVLGIAGLSLVAFTGTSMAPAMHEIRETAQIDFPGESGADPKTESGIQDIFDTEAQQHGLHCIVCDALSKGRIYSHNDSVYVVDSFALTVSYDAARKQVFYSLKAYNYGGQDIPRDRLNEMNLMRSEIQNLIRASYPAVKITVAANVHAKLIQLGVWKKKTFTSYAENENQADAAQALEVIRAVALNLGLQEVKGPVNSTIYSYGRLFGPHPRDRELVVDFGIADDPLVYIDVSCYSPDCLDLQHKLAVELDWKLKKAFGYDRAGPRCLIPGLSGCTISMRNKGNRYG